MNAGCAGKLWDPLRTRAIPERLRGVFTTRRYKNARLPYLTLPNPNVKNVIPTRPYAVYETPDYEKISVRNVCRRLCDV